AKLFFPRRASAPASCRQQRRNRKRCWGWSTNRLSSTVSRRPSNRAATTSSWSPAAARTRSKITLTSPSSSKRVWNHAARRSNWRYILSRDIFPVLPAANSDRTEEIQLPNGLCELLKTRPVYACEIKGVRHDTGNKLGLLKAVVYFALRRPDLADGFKASLAS